MGKLMLPGFFILIIGILILGNGCSTVGTCFDPDYRKEHEEKCKAEKNTLYRK